MLCACSRAAVMMSIEAATAQLKPADTMVMVIKRTENVVLNLKKTKNPVVIGAAFTILA